MKKIKVYYLTSKNKNKNLFFFQKIIVFTLLFLSIISLTNFNIYTLNNLLWNISKFWKGLTWPQNNINNYLNQIHNDHLIWPFKKVTNRGIIEEFWYHKALYTDWNNLPDKYKTNFPTQNISDFMETYKYIPPSNIWAYIANPLERQKVLFFKRLFTTAWTANYKCDNKICLRWIKNSWLHNWQDIVSSINTPIVSIATWLVIQKKYNPKWFWNYLIILSEIDGKVFATFYGHLNKFADNVKEWDIVKQWQLIGYVWKTWIATAPHLHLQINKLGNINDIKNKNINWLSKKLFFKSSLEKIKKYTYDPITFIENHFKKKNNTLASIWILEENNLWNLTFAPPRKENFKIIKIINPKISWKLTVWDNIKIQLITTWTFWNIIITSKKWLLKTNPNNIIPISWKTQFNIQIIATKPWNDEIIISDGFKSYSYTFTIYPKNKPIIKFLKIVGPNTIYKFALNKYKLTTIDNLWNIGNIKLNWLLFIKLIDTTTNKLIFNEKNEIKSNSTLVDIIINTQKIKNLSTEHSYKLKIAYIDKNWKTYFVSKKLNVDLFIDFSKNNTFSKEIDTLATNWIIEWLSWQLLPNEPLTKAELITILVRYKFGNNYKKWKEKYINYYDKNWPIFKDLSKNNFWAPYIFKAWKEWIIKWYNWYSLYNKKVNLLELILMYWRTFNIKTDDPFVIWKNLKNTEEITAFAKAAKKYNLYPFENTDIFEKNKTVTRLNAFISLFRYINFKPKNLLTHTHASSETLETNQKEKVKKLIETLLNY